MPDEELEKHVRQHENPQVPPGPSPEPDPNAGRNAPSPALPPAPAEEVQRAAGTPEQGAQAARASLGKKPAASRDDVNAPVRHDRPQPFGADRPSDADLEKELTAK